MRDTIRYIFIMLLIAGTVTDIKEYRRSSRRYGETSDNTYQRAAKRWRRCAVCHGIMTIYLIADIFM